MTELLILTAVVQRPEPSVPQAMFDCSAELAALTLLASEALGWKPEVTMVGITTHLQT
jgi:hypothetical protein